MSTHTTNPIFPDVDADGVRDVIVFDHDITGDNVYARMICDLDGSVRIQASVPNGAHWVSITGVIHPETMSTIYGGVDESGDDRPRLVTVSAYCAGNHHGTNDKMRDQSIGDFTFYVNAATGGYVMDINTVDSSCTLNDYFSIAHTDTDAVERFIDASQH